ncbi:hypothetical protein GCM10025857_12320 [Alicyclobacillus contaminans]|nr:hypothetical protein GCM10025857_12320 [Alicyclobacillus contaminans]
MTPQDILRLMKENNVEMVDFRIVDVPGRQHHVTIPAVEIDEEVLERGVAFDGSSIQGFRGIEESDMVMRPVLETAFIDPFMAAPTLSLACTVYEPNGTRYDRDPRYIAEKAEAYLQQSGIASAAYFGPELEFFIFDDVRFDSSHQGAFYQVDSEEAMWNTGTGEKNLGYKVKNKGGISRYRLWILNKISEPRWSKS